MNVRNPGSNPGDRSPILLPRTKNGGKSAVPRAATSTVPSDNYSGSGPTTITHSRPPQFFFIQNEKLQSYSRRQRGNCCNFLLICADDAIIAPLRVTAVSAKQCQTMLLLDWIVFCIWLYGVAISSTNVATRNHVSRYIMLEHSFNFPFVRYVDIPSILPQDARKQIKIFPSSTLTSRFLFRYHWNTFTR